MVRLGLGCVVIACFGSSQPVFGQPAAATAQTNPLSNPAEVAYQRVLRIDDEARADIDAWIKEQQADPLANSPLQSATLKARIQDRLEKVRDAYQDMIDRFPNHAEARLAYGSFLNEVQEEEPAREQWETSRTLDGSNPAAWNNLANYYGHNGMPEKAFAYYEKAIELNPAEPVYYQNLATTLYLFRRDGTNFYKLPLMEVMEKSMAFYAKALELDPENFILASEIAQTYYGIPAPKTGSPEGDAKALAVWQHKALEAWRHAYKLARDDVEREGVRLHLARVQINAGRFSEARTELNAVTNEMYRATKRNLLQLLESGSSASPEAKSSQLPRSPASP